MYTYIYIRLDHFLLACHWDTIGPARYRGSTRSVDDNENFNNPLPSFLSFFPLGDKPLSTRPTRIDGWILNDPSKGSSKGDRSISSKSMERRMKFTFLWILV